MRPIVEDRCSQHFLAIDQHAMGEADSDGSKLSGPVAFSWVELVTSDSAAATPFYEEVFGWTAVDSTTSGGTYVLLQQDHADVAGLYEMGDKQREGNIRPHWLPYVSVPSVDEALVRAGDLGASLINPPTDIGAGRMSVIEDPTGAVLAFWEAKEHPGTGLLGEPGSLTWMEHLSPRPDAAISFYTTLFNWTAESSGSSAHMHSSLRGEVGDVAGVVQSDERERARWRVYFSVEETQSTRDRIERNGGVIEAEAERPNGLAAHATDPQGASFGILQAGSERKDQETVRA